MRCLGMTDEAEQLSPADRLSAELEALRQQLRTEEAEWATWRESHKVLTSDTRRDGLLELRNRIYFLEAKLQRATRARPEAPSRSGP